jgi:propionyl-CoA synthetase
VRERIGPVAAFKDAPCRRAPAQDPLGQDPARHHAQIADGRTGQVPATIDDPAILPEIAEALAAIGYAHPAEEGVA